MARQDRKVSELIAEAPKGWFSFEYFPPRSEDGVTNLKARMHRMNQLGPLFMDFTWGAGGSTSELTQTLCEYVKDEVGSVANMHLTCTNMEKAKVDAALANSKEAGICNLVALRGDPPRGQEKWAAAEGGFTCALDLVEYIRQEHGDYFSTAVAGYPEGHQDAIEVVEGGLAALSESERRRARVALDEEGKEVVTVCRDAKFEQEMRYLKRKIDAGGDLIITQMFLDAQVFLDFVNACRAWDIHVPVVPGIMCLNTLGGLKRMSSMCKTRLPEGMLEAAEAANTSDEAFKNWGIEYGVDMCRKLLEGGATGLHFYTLNLEKVVLGVLLGLGLITAAQLTKVSAGEADAKTMVSAQGITTEKAEPQALSAAVVGA